MEINEKLTNVFREVFDDDTLVLHEEMTAVFNGRTLHGTSLISL